MTPVESRMVKSMERRLECEPLLSNRMLSRFFLTELWATLMRRMGCGRVEWVERVVGLLSCILKLDIIKQ